MTRVTHLSVNIQTAAHPLPVVCKRCGAVVTAFVGCQEWQRSAKEAAGLVEGREAAVAGLAARLERGLALLGATAVEDRLQEGVPQAIATLLRAGLKVPVL
jgi:hypothetical protein